MILLNYQSILCSIFLIRIVLGTFDFIVKLGSTTGLIRTISDNQNLVTFASRTSTTSNTYKIQQYDYNANTTVLVNSAITANLTKLYESKGNTQPNTPKNNIYILYDSFNTTVKNSNLSTFVYSWVPSSGPSYMTTMGW